MSHRIDTKFFRLSDTDLTLKDYYFPLGQPKVINIQKIRGIYWEEQNVVEQIGMTKSWGMGRTNCWWANDRKRNYHFGKRNYYNVVIDCGERTFKGFSVTNIDNFVQAIKPLLVQGTVIENFLPFN